MSMPDTSVKIFRSTDGGAPAGPTTAAGSLLPVLRACLVSGYGSVTVTPLVVSAGVATATVSTGHGFQAVGTTGPVVLISGASPAALNGEKRITVASATQFTFEALGVPDGAATGTIAAKMAPAGWEEPFTGTNKAVFRSAAADALRNYLRIDDTAGSVIYARAVGYEAMTDVDTGTGPFPTAAQFSGGLYVGRGNTTTPVPWIVVASDRDLYYIADLGLNTTNRSALSWIEPTHLKAGDAYATQISASAAASITGGSISLLGASGRYSARAISGISGAINSAVTGPHRGTTAGTMMAAVDASPPLNDGKILAYPVEVRDSSTGPFRGFAPGVCCVNQAPDVVAGTGTFNLITDGPLAQRTLAFIGISATTIGMAIDVSGPWR